MKEPVLLGKTGRAYEYYAISQRLKQAGPIDPVTGVRLYFAPLIPNLDLKRAIEFYFPSESSDYPSFHHPVNHGLSRVRREESKDHGLDALDVLTWEESEIDKEFRLLAGFAWNPNATRDEWVNKIADLYVELHGGARFALARRESNTLLEKVSDEIAVRDLRLEISRTLNASPRCRRPRQRPALDVRGSHRAQIERVI